MTVPKHPDNIDPAHEDLAHDPMEDLKKLSEHGYGWQRRLAEVWLKRAARAERLNRCRSTLLRQFLACHDDGAGDLYSLIEEVRRHLRDDGAM